MASCRDPLSRRRRLQQRAVAVTSIDTAWPSWRASCSAAVSRLPSGDRLPVATAWRARIPGYATWTWRWGPQRLPARRSPNTRFLWMASLPWPSDTERPVLGPSPARSTVH